MNVGNPLVVGYDIIYGVVTTSMAQFNIFSSGNPAYILELNFRWVATVGEHLQLFPISSTSANNDERTIPFDYKNMVKWSNGDFEV